MPPIDKTLVRNRLISARRRLSDLQVMGQKINALAQERQQLTEEFFFHAVAAIEMLTQLVNEGRSLGMPMEKANRGAWQARWLHRTLSRRYF